MGFRPTFLFMGGVMREYYLFGLQRSGTNFLEKIIHHNYLFKSANHNMAPNRNLWKHNINPTLKEYNKSHLAIHMHKNPYTWIESICTRNDAQWAYYQKEYSGINTDEPEYELGPNKINVKVLAKAWSVYHSNWKIFLSDKNHITVKYEDLLTEDGLNRCIESFNIMMGLNSEFDSLVIPEKIPYSNKFSDDDKSYYMNQIPKVLNQNHIKAINECLDNTIMSSYNYMIL